MDPFPEEWELLSLFASEPTLLDPGVPWFYNMVTFTLDRPIGRVECSIEAAGRVLTFRYATEGRTVVALAVNGVAGLATWRDAEGEGLAVTPQDPTRGELRIQVSPNVSVVWNRPPT